MHTIELRGDESITAILSHLQQATDVDVLLFVPRGCEALERDQVNLRLLRRWADNLALRVGLVVQDRHTQVLAREAGFTLFPSIQAGQAANLGALDRQRRRQRGLPAHPRPSLLFTPSPQTLGQRAGLKGLSRAGVSLLVTATTVLALAVVVMIVLPSATVVLQPVHEPIEASMEMTGVAGLAEINYAEGEVPARTVSVEIEGFDTIATTNKRDIPDGHAQGTVDFANKTSIPVTITKGTVLRTSFGKNVRFYTVADLWLPGELYATVRVGILAAEPGPSGNVPSLTVNVVEGGLAAHVDALNSQATSGGTVRRMSTVDGVDKVNLRAKLVERLQREAYSELTAGLGPDDFIPADSLVIQVLHEQFDHKIDDITDELGLSMRVEASGLAVDGEPAKTLMLSLLQQRTKAGYRLLEDSTTFQRGAVLSASPEKARFNMSARAFMAPAIDTSQVSSAIAGKPVGWAKDYLARQYPLAREPEIDLTGALLQRLPFWPARTVVRVTTA